MAKKTTKVMDLCCCGKHYEVIFHHDTNRNPFWLYELKWAYDKYLRGYTSKTLVTKMQNMESILYTLIEDPAFKKDVW